MSKSLRKVRRIALFVEGDTERGDARRRTLPTFFHRWLDPQLPAMSRVGIIPVKFQGVSNYLDDLGQKVGLYLDNDRANFVFGLVDLYGIPPDRIDLSRYTTIPEKVKAARVYIRGLVPQQYQDRFHQHFAVHEVEAWLLAYLEQWPAEVQGQLRKRPPEQVNFNEPPARFLNASSAGATRRRRPR